MKVEKVKGTRDFFPDEMRRRSYILERMSSVFERYGYRMIGTPTFEHTELFTLKSGEEIETHMYSFTDKKGRSLCLRPEGTAPVCRMYSEGMRGFALPIKLYYFGPMFRYEEPQKGRYREFWQLGMELIGASGLESDIEAITLASDCLGELGLEYTLEIGHLDVVRGLLRGLGMDDALQRKIISLIDKRDTEGIRDLTDKEVILKLMELSGDRSVLEEAKNLLSGFDESVKALEILCEIADILDRLKVGYTINLGVARGLEYYTGVVFEIRVPGLGAQNQVCGGGRYDELIGLFSGMDVPAIGFAYGFDRVLEAMEYQGIEIPPSDRGIVIAPIGEVRGEALSMAKELRSSHKVDIDLMERKLGKIMEHAGETCAKYVVIVGKKDLERGVVTVRDMDSGQQEEVPLKDISGYMKERLG